MFSRSLGGCFWLGLLPAILVAGKVLAHPVVPDERTLQADAEQADVRRATDGISDASAFARQASSASERARGLPLAPTGYDDRSAVLADSLARGSDLAVPAFARLQPGINVSAITGGVDDADPLPGLRRSVVDGALHGSGMASPARAVRSAATAAAGRGEDAAAALNELQESVVEVIAEALDVRVGKDGRVDFSVAGVEGFHVVSAAGRVTLGLDNTAVTFVQYGSDTPAARPVPATASPNPEPVASAGGFNPAREFVGLVIEVVQYPLLWVILFFLIVAKIAWLVVTRRGRKRRHHSHRASQPTRLKVKRSRSRSRHKSVPAAGITGPAAASPQES